MYKRIWLIIVPLLALSLSGKTAIGSGGTQVGENDDVDAIIGLDGNFYASGALGTVRNEPEGPGTEQQVFNKWIGCWVDSTRGTSAAGTLTPGFAMVTCMAIAERSIGTNRHDLRCTSRDPAMIAAVGAMNSDSMIRFETPTALVDGSGECLYIKVENNSKFRMKGP